MNDIPIEKWSTLASKRKWDALLLGNGASIAIDKGFAYGSLHQVAQQANLLGASSAVFTRLQTTDFEQVLLAMWHAELVNDALGSPSSRITQAYADVRTALFRAVQQVHCQPHIVSAHQSKIESFCKGFATVVTFNYDLTLYWALMTAQSNVPYWFKDCFYFGKFAANWQSYRQPYGAASGSTLFFYGHGSLILTRDQFANESKIANPLGGGALLLNVIPTNWVTSAPIFVSEGTSAEKMRAIRRSSYLSTVYDEVLRGLGSAVVAYGLGFNANDQHILDALKTGPPSELAVSVYLGNGPPAAQRECHRILAQVQGALPNTTVTFFDSASSGAWIH